MPGNNQKIKKTTKTNTAADKINSLVIPNILDFNEQKYDKLMHIYITHLSETNKLHTNELAYLVAFYLDHKPNVKQKLIN